MMRACWIVDGQPQDTFAYALLRDEWQVRGGAHANGENIRQ